jgi:ligand-binding SRPBCC domain-containing protein
MPLIEQTTEIKAPIDLCFNLARSIDLHKLSTIGSNEEAIAGVTSGMIGLGEEVTWQATHFGIRQLLTSRITSFDSPHYFRDEMVSGAFKMMKHDHRFEVRNETTIMMDRFEYESPMGWLGRIFNQLVLHDYLLKLIVQRNSVIKDYAESMKWKLIIK